MRVGAFGDGQLGSSSRALKQGQRQLGEWLAPGGRCCHRYSTGPCGVGRASASGVRISVTTLRKSDDGRDHSSDGVPSPSRSRESVSLFRKSNDGGAFVRSESIATQREALISLGNISPGTGGTTWQRPCSSGRQSFSGNHNQCAPRTITKTHFGGRCD